MLTTLELKFKKLKLKNGKDNMVKCQGKLYKTV